MDNQNQSESIFITDDKSKVRIISKSLFQKLAFRKLISFPIWGGKYSYIIVETDPAQEFECIHALQSTAAPERRRAILGSVLGLSPSQPLPCTLDDALIALKKVYPPGDDDNRRLNELILETSNSAAKYTGSDDEFRMEIIVRRKVLEWKRILTAVPDDVNHLLAAWNRLERDQVYEVVNRRLMYLSATTLQYFNSNVAAIKKQEDRWKNGVSMGGGELIFFWLWVIVMQLGVIVPDTISVLLGAVLAVFRSGPIRLQSQIMVIAVLDFPWSDERLARFITFQRFLGLLPTALFGIFALLNPSFRRTAFKGIDNLAWKACICISWQMLMHNWKNLYDLYYFKRITRTELTDLQIIEVTAEHEKLKCCNAYAYAWFEMYGQSNRFGAQASYYKQDHEDAANSLKWAAAMKEHQIPRDDFGSKVSIWSSIIAIGSIICASTFPVDPYAGLGAIAYYAPLIVRAAVDVWDPSQSFDDLLRLFTTTAGPTFPSTMLLLVNLAYWVIANKALFVGFHNLSFCITFSILFVLSLYPKLWAEAFKNGGLWMMGRLAGKEGIAS